MSSDERTKRQREDEIARAPIQREGGIIAFFDMDLTLIGVNSAQLWAMHLWRTGGLSTSQLMRSFGWLARYKMALIDIEQVTSMASRHVAGQPEGLMIRQMRRWYEAEVRQHILPHMAAQVKSHQARGHHTVLLTASSPYLSAPLSEELALDDYICTRFEVDAGGCLTGELVRPLCYGQGKVTLAQRWAKERGLSLELAYFYTDSYTDLPMLQRVGRPVVVNPDPRLKRHARRHGIPTL